MFCSDVDGRPLHCAVTCTSTFTGAVTWKSSPSGPRKPSQLIGALAPEWSYAAKTLNDLLIDPTVTSAIFARCVSQCITALACLAP